jgi:DNA-directed RNA polymerase alpha subunit/DNA-directed RNA polymerase subunit L
MSSQVAISNISEEAGVYRFTLSNVPTSIANGIRRTILSDIPLIVIPTENYKDNLCHVEINTTRMHNEIIKQRLSCIPIHMKNLEALPGKYILELDVENTTDTSIYATTEDFRIRNKDSGNELTKEETQKIFPPNEYTNHYIDFVRLRPKISDTIPGERIKLTAEFSVSTAKKNSMYNVVSKCSYANTPDLPRISEIWSQKEESLIAKEHTKEEIAHQKRDFHLLDAQRIFISNSFDFVVQSIGIYENTEIVKMACSEISKHLSNIVESIESDTLLITRSASTMDFCFDVHLEYDYTIGNILEQFLYDSHFEGDKTISYCGFKKMHPHYSNSILRIAFVQNMDNLYVKQYLRQCAMSSQETIKQIYNLF